MAARASALSLPPLQATTTGRTAIDAPHIGVGGMSGPRDRVWRAASASTPQVVRRLLQLLAASPLLGAKRSSAEECRAALQGRPVLRATRARGRPGPPSALPSRARRRRNPTA